MTRSDFEDLSISASKPSTSMQMILQNISCVQKFSLNGITKQFHFVNSLSIQPASYLIHTVFILLNGPRLRGGGGMGAY